MGSMNLVFIDIILTGIYVYKDMETQELTDVNYLVALARSAQIEIPVIEPIPSISTVFDDLPILGCKDDMVEEKLFI